MAGNLERKFITGAQIAVLACQDAGAEMMYGYPITPATELFTGWIKSKKKYLQTEDEIAAGFAVCGAVMAGQKAFTATSGPGHILMQDALSMAEGMRLPFVTIIAQRGGPSSGTVIYSQQEVTLAIFGGNGEGMRLVYSPSTLRELYVLTRQAFNDAWAYRFPAIVLTDGYLVKTKGVFEKPEALENIVSYPLVKEGEIVHWPNIYTIEDDLYNELEKNRRDFLQASQVLAIAELYKTEGADIILAAHGLVGAAARVAVDILRQSGAPVGLFRPITLSPFPQKQLNDLARTAAKMVVVESSFGQFARILKDGLTEEKIPKFAYLQKPALGIEPEEIAKFVKQIL